MGIRDFVDTWSMASAIGSRQVMGQGARERKFPRPFGVGA